MSYRYGVASTSRLETCHEQIQVVFKRVIKYVDCSILEGHRSIERQTELYNTVLPDGSRLTKIDGISQKGNHNYDPSRAVDAIPYPGKLHGQSVWHDQPRLCLFAGIVLGIAFSEGVLMRWGGDWQSDGSPRNDTFFDGPHYELVGL